MLLILQYTYCVLCMYNHTIGAVVRAQSRAMDGGRMGGGRVEMVMRWWWWMVMAAAECLVVAGAGIVQHV